MAKPTANKTETPAAPPANPEPTTALETKGTTAMVEFEDYGDDAGAGYENQTAADTATPFLQILQAQSPQVLKNDPKGARAGMFYNPVTGELIDGEVGVLILPVTTQHSFARFTPRDKGGGFKGNLEPEDPIVVKAKAESKSFGEYVVEGDELTETFYVPSIYAENPDQPYPIMIAFSSAAIKLYKQWMSRLRSFVINQKDGEGKVIGRQAPPLFAHLTRMTTKLVQKDQYMWYQPVLTPAKETIPASLLGKSDPRFQAAKGFKDLVDAGQAKINYESQGAPVGGGEGTAEAADAAF